MTTNTIPIRRRIIIHCRPFSTTTTIRALFPYNGEASPTLILPSREAEQKLKFIREQIVPLEKSLQPAPYQEAFERW
jgi:hypothetical protein